MSVLQQTIRENPAAVEAEADRLFRAQRHELFVHTDRMFAVLMAVQWVAAIAAALWISPRTWQGRESYTHLHVWMAIFLGGAIASLPIFLAIRHPGRLYTRHTIALAQVMFSALLIDITGGRIETHFHVFVSLAFLAIYKDWPLLIPATVFVAVDHLLRGIYLPQSVYGVVVASPWRWLEHSAWLIFEDIVLIYTCRRSVLQLHQVAERTAELAERTREVESALQSNRAILDAALDAVVTIDVDDRIVDWNPQAELLFGLSRATAVGRTLTQTLIPPAYHQRHLQGLSRYLQSGQSAVVNRRIEVVALSASGGEFPVELSVVPIHFGGQLRFTAFIRDITDRRRNELAAVAATKAAISADRAKSEFLAKMSHEIRTPLNGILGFARLLLDDHKIAAAQREEYLRTIYASGSSLLGLVNDILDLSKIEAGYLEVDRVACSPGRIIAEVTSLLRVKALEKGIRLEARCAGGVHSVIESDPARLRQLLMNLIGNAVKFTDHGLVDVTARFVDTERGVRFRVEVRDTGPGIPPDCLERVFAPFVQVDSSAARKHGGTGLGLAISLKIAEALGGHLTVVSQQGLGSLFSAEIDPGPRHVAAATELLPVEIADVKTAPSTWVDSGKLSGTILLVEDGESNRKLISHLLRRTGIEVVEAENGEAGLDKVAQAPRPFDLILMDMQMPVMDGYTATTRLREQGVMTPIVALTAHAMKGDELKCRAAGCSDYLSKPIQFEALIGLIRRTLAPAAAREGEDSAVETIGDTAGAGVQMTPTSTLSIDDAQVFALVSDFRDSLVERVETMRQAFQRGDMPELARLLHWLKGTGGTFGFAELSHIAGRLETLVERESTQQIDASLAELEAMIGRIHISPIELPNGGGW